jgi:uncharacterized protein
MDAGSIPEQLSHTGLAQSEIALITNTIRHHGAIRRAILFGSRAKGVARPNSDIDLAIEGVGDELDVARLALELDDLPLPYRFDLKRLESIAFQPLKEHIERVGVIIYQK